MKLREREREVNFSSERILKKEMKKEFGFVAFGSLGRGRKKREEEKGQGLPSHRGKNENKILNWGIFVI